MYGLFSFQSFIFFVIIIIFILFQFTNFNTIKSHSLNGILLNSWKLQLLHPFSQSVISLHTCFYSFGFVHFIFFISIRVFNFFLIAVLNLLAKLFVAINDLIIQFSLIICHLLLLTFNICEKCHIYHFIINVELVIPLSDVILSDGIHEIVARIWSWLLIWTFINIWPLLCHMLFWLIGEFQLYFIDTLVCLSFVMCHEIIALFPFVCNEMVFNWVVLY